MEKIKQKNLFTNLIIKEIIENLLKLDFKIKFSHLNF